MKTYLVYDFVLDDTQQEFIKIDKINSKLQLWNDAGDAVIKEWDVTDKDGVAIELQGTGPVNRGVPSTP